jgi:hypothetical protein
MRINSGHPRRSKSDLIDAGWRLFLSLSLLGIWAFLLALLATSSFRGPEWVVYAALPGLAIVPAVGFAILTIRAVVVDRSWLRAERMAREDDARRLHGMTSE